MFVFFLLGYQLLFNTTHGLYSTTASLESTFHNLVQEKSGSGKSIHITQDAHGFRALLEGIG